MIPSPPSKRAAPQYRKAQGSDIVEATKLLNRYHSNRQDAEHRHDGFIAATFTPEQLNIMNEEIGVTVAAVAGEIVGCLCCYDSNSPAVPAPARAMTERFPGWHYGGRRLTEWRTFLYGPVVIDRAARGRGILRGLYREMLGLVAARYEVGTAFVGKTNHRSMAVHRDGLGMTPVGEFVFAGEVFVALAFDVRPT
jgi:predicted GNAT superfamily acetyltransferase